MSCEFEASRSGTSGGHERDRHLGRVFSILRAIGSIDSPVTLSRIVRRTGLPKSTVHRLLAELHLHDVISRSGDHYQLGRLVRQLVVPSRDDEVRVLRRVLRPVLTALYERTHWLVGLGVTSGLAVQFVDLVYGQNYCRLVERLEEGADLHASVAGKALLAYDRDLLTTWTERARQCPGMACTDLLAELSEIRRSGIATSVDVSPREITALAMPVLGDGERPVAALSMGKYGGQHADIASTSTLLRQAGLHARRLLRTEAAKGNVIGMRTPGRS